MPIPLFRNQYNPALEQVKSSLRSIGYRDDLLVENYKYADVLNKNYTLGEIAVGTFAQTPPSYRNACIGVIETNGKFGVSAVTEHRGFGAPLIFELREKTLERWKITEKGKPEWRESVSHDQIADYFEKNSALWEPDRIFRAKVIGDIEDVKQLDFFDAGLLTLLEGQIHKKLDVLLREALAEITEAYQEFGRIEPNFEDIYRIVFRFIVAKVMKDREHSIGIQTNDAVEVFATVEDYYNLPVKALSGVKNREKILEVAWKAISGSFHFQNISVDDFAFIYESSLITPESRKLFGTHITPPRIAEYITQKLPFEDIPETDRFVLEPCSGHGGFLVAASRRLKELYSNSHLNEDRHRYLTEKITAIEIEPFAVEACWSRLVLADYPYPNGWQLKTADVFKDPTFEEDLKKCRILLCNPPFEDFSAKERSYYKNFNIDVAPRKPVELLKRILQHPPAMMGLVLPRSFETGAAYQPFHRQIAEAYDSVELISLPEVFNYSDATTTLVLASGKREHYSGVSVTYRQVTEVEKKEFLKGVEPPAAKTSFEVEDYLKPKFSLMVAPLSKVWKHLSHHPKLKDVVEIHRGIQWKARTDKAAGDRKEISNEPKKDYKIGYYKVERGGLRQYILQNPQYLSMKSDDQLTGNYLLDWDKEKIVFNAARLTRGPWRLGSVVNTGGVFSKNFFSGWVKSSKVSAFAVAAVLNSPLANAFVFTNASGKHNHAKLIKSLPIPSIESLAEGSIIDSLSKEIHEQMTAGQHSEVNQKLLQIDAEIFREYSLPLSLEQDITDLFQGFSRPVPFDSSGYYSNDYFALRYGTVEKLIEDESIHIKDSSVRTLQTIFTLANPKEIEKFLNNKEDLHELLLEADHKIKEYFGKTTTGILELKTDPEEGFATLYIKIPTKLPADEAFDILEMLNENWWIEAISQTNNEEVNFLLEYVT